MDRMPGTVVLDVMHEGGGPQTRRPKRFFRINKEDKRVRANLALGTKLHFPQGIMMRCYSQDGFGGWGHVPRQFWRVTYAQQSGKRGIMLPAGRERVGVKRPPTFIPLGHLRVPVIARVV